MSYRYDALAPGEVYHICTRGVEQREIFRNDGDRWRFLKLMIHCLPVSKRHSFSMALKYKQTAEMTPEGKGLVDVLCYCLMSNHIHMLVRENTEGGTSKYMLKLLTSYAKYFNMSEGRTGSLFQNPFRAVLVDGDDQFLHVSRYIHLNPYVAHMTKDPLDFGWSSVGVYVGGEAKIQCHKSMLGRLMKPVEYQSFLVDEADYARSLADIQHIVIDNDD